MKRIKFKARPFVAFQIEPTSRCQLKCVICPRTVFSEEWESGDMPLSVYKKISKYFHLVEDVYLKGWGEPLLHPNLFDMIQIAKAKHCCVSLTTNGILLTPDISERLIEKGVDTIAVSISGASKETHENIRRGSHFEQIINNIKVFSNLKVKMGTQNPKLVFSFLMTKTNIEELPKALDLAKDIGINEMVATNLDYTPTQVQDDMRVFSCNGADSNIKNSIKIAMEKANKIKLPFRVYPLKTKEVIMCKLNPLQIVFFSHDGCVSPCVYLNMRKRGSIPRIFFGSYYEVQRLCFGSISKNDFMKIRDNDDYKNFRGIYINRLYLFRKIYSDFEYGIKTIGKIKEVGRVFKNVMANHPVPHACRTCYKAYNI